MVSGSAPLPNDYVSNDYTARASGIIIDTPSSFASSPSSSSTPDHRQTLIRACVDAFRSKLSFFNPRNTSGRLAHRVVTVNVILVVGHEKLNVEMQRTYGNRMTVVKIPKSGGVCICSFLASSMLLFFLYSHVDGRSLSSTSTTDNASTPSNCILTSMARRSHLRPDYQSHQSATLISTDISRPVALSSHSANSPSYV